MKLTNTMKKQLEEAIKVMATAKETLGAITALEDTQSDMQEAYDEKSERWQEGEAGEQYAGWIDTVETVVQDTEGLCDSIDELISSIEDLVGEANG